MKPQNTDHVPSPSKPPGDNRFVGNDPNELYWLDGERVPEKVQPAYDPDAPLVVDADYDD